MQKKFKLFNGLKFNLLSCFLLIFIIACRNNESPQQSNKPLNNFPIVKKNTSKQINSNQKVFDRLISNVKTMRLSTFHAKKSNKGFEKLMLGNMYFTQYDKNGNALQKAYYNSTKKLQSTILYEVNIASLCEQAVQYAASKSVLKKISYAYDSESNRSSEIQRNASGEVISKTLFKYDPNGLLQEEIKYLGQTHLEQKIMYAYNSNQEITETTYYKPDGSKNIICKTTYMKHDARGNWIQCIEQTNKGSIFLVEREIEYFE